MLLLRPPLFEPLLLLLDLLSAADGATLPLLLLALLLADLLMLLICCCCCSEANVTIADGLEQFQSLAVLQANERQAELSDVACQAWSPRNAYCTARVTEQVLMHLAYHVNDSCNLCKWAVSDTQLYTTCCATISSSSSAPFFSAAGINASADTSDTRAFEPIFSGVC
jgi:hypothetical protein